MFTIKNLKPRSGVKVKVNFRQNKILFDDLYWNSSLALQVSEHRPPSHFFILFSVPFQWRFWKDAQAWHLPNSAKATKVLQVSKTTGTPLGFLEPQTPVPSTRPWLLQCPWNCTPSRLSWQSCWPSMLRKGPEEKRRWKHKQLNPTNNIWIHLRESWLEDYISQPFRAI